MWFKASCGYDRSVCVWFSCFLFSKNNLLWRVDWGHMSHCTWEGENFCIWKSRWKRKQLRNNKISLVAQRKQWPAFLFLDTSLQDLPPWGVNLGWIPDAHPSSSGQGEKNKTKGSWVKIRTGRSPSNYHHRQNRLSLGKLISFDTNQVRIGEWGTKPNIKDLPSTPLLFPCSDSFPIFCASSCQAA